MDSDVHLHEMSPSRLDAWKAAKRSRLVEDSGRIAVDPEAAVDMLDLARESGSDSAVRSDEQYVWSLVQGSVEIGSVWVRMQRRAAESWAFVQELEVRDEAGTAGVGSTALSALEGEVAGRGADHIQLKAAADVQRHYELRGYEPVVYEIAKPMVGGPPIDYDNPPDVRLQPMSQEQYDDYLTDLAAAQPFTQGRLRAKQQAFLAGYHEEEMVGRAWIILEERNDGLHSLVNDIRVEPEMRAQGYGRGFMAAIYAHLKELGVITSRSKVFASNTRAQAVFAQAGYEVTHVYLKKALATP